MKKPWKIDIPVALIFFNRPDQFVRVFDTVLEARPSRLFLIQDGARKNNNSDVVNIQKCRNILKNIDWECEIHTDFASDNLGCGKRIYTGLTNCFKQVDKLIILEDDCIPAQSFFTFCKEMLEKYLEERQIGMITGMNHLNIFENVNSDYFFAKVGSIAGWATWKRMWDLVDYNMECLDDKETIRVLKNIDKYESVYQNVYKKACEKKKVLYTGGKLSSWSTQYGIASILNSPLIIVPKINLMTNIGLSPESTNSVSSLKMVPRRQRQLYKLKLFEMEFPLNHPMYIVDNHEYDKMVNKFMNPPYIIAFFNKLESVLLRLVYGDFKSIVKGIRRRMNRTS